MSSIVPVVLSGGVGTRLWPLSRRSEPKQFQALIGREDMLSETLARVRDLGTTPMVVASRAHVEPLVARTDSVRIVAEPRGRNTAPAIAAAAMLSGPDDLLVVMPADHHIGDLVRFRHALELALDSARAGYLTTFGVVPDRPETGYGYIVPDRMSLAESGDGPRPISEFVEKPDEERALQLIEAGALWNSGMFVFPVAALLDELAQWEPAIFEAVKRSVASATDEPWGTALGAEFGDAPSVSIDVAVMERTPRAAVVALRADWSDIGSWATLWELGDKDEDDNVVIGPVTVLASSGNYLRSEGARLAVSGVDDLVVVATPSAILVTTRAQAQSVKELIELLDSKDR
jgi:mannose-1-phosphate guanylyltransferase/mannose-6-phosphate isomerase